MGLTRPVKYKFGEPEDVASLVSYLASKEAHYITGEHHVLSINATSDVAHPSFAGQTVRVANLDTTFGHQ